MNTQYQIVLPLCPSVNNYLVTDRRGGRTYSKETKQWFEIAGRYWRSQFPEGIELLKGRLRAQYVFVFCDEIRRDIGNYEKVVADYLQGKFYIDDWQIDEIDSRRRVIKTNQRNKVFIYITEIEDKRYMDMLHPEWDEAYAD